MKVFLRGYFDIEGFSPGFFSFLVVIPYVPRTKVVLRKPRITEKDLRESVVLGLATKEDFEIDIEKNQNSKEFLSTLIHECCHVWLPDLSEANIIKMSDMLRDIIWSKGYRRLMK